MTKQQHLPKEINLDQKARILRVSFDGGEKFDLPCEYLRVFSPSAENKVAQARGEMVTDKAQVNITQIEPMGSYAVRLVFDDGHDSGIYSWDKLHELGTQQSENWATYQKQLAAAAEGSTNNAPFEVRVLYFADLAEEIGAVNEWLTVPESTETVSDLLEFLRNRGGQWEASLQEARLKITLNKQFSTVESAIKANDEIALVLQLEG